MATRRKAAKKKAASRRSAVRGARRRPAAKKRVAKKRVAKKRVAKKRVAKKRVAKKHVAKKRPARKAAKQRAARRPARKAAKKRAAKKRPARKAAKRPAARRAAKPAKPARRPAAKPRARKPAAPAAFAPQKAEATAKDLLLFELERARVSVLAAIQGLGAGTAMQRVGEGKWSTHEIVLHLCVRDRVRLDEFDSMLAGHPPSWANVAPGAEQAAANEEHLAALRGTSWDDAVRMLMTTRAELIERLRTVPAEPAEVWTESHPFGASMYRLPGHDRRHAEAIKNARIAG